MANWRNTFTISTVEGSCLCYIKSSCKSIKMMNNSQAKDMGRQVITDTPEG